MTEQTLIDEPAQARAMSTPRSVSGRLDAAIRFGLGFEDDVDVSGMAYGETEEWDSVAHMQLVAALENEFDLMIETDDVIAMSDYGEIRRIVRERYGVALEA